MRTRRRRRGKSGAAASGDGAANDVAAPPATGSAAAGNSDAGTPETGTAAAGSPAEPVQDFYELAAAGDYKGAWALAGGGFRSQLGGYSAFESQVSDLESVDFESLEVTSESGDTAQVSFSDVATHTDYIDTCTGTFTVVSSGESWVLDRGDINCQRG